MIDLFKLSPKKTDIPIIIPDLEIPGNAAKDWNNEAIIIIFKKLKLNFFKKCKQIIIPENIKETPIAESSLDSLFKKSLKNKPMTPIGIKDKAIIFLLALIS